MRGRLISILFVTMALAACTKTSQDVLSSILVFVDTESTKAEILDYGAVWKTGDKVGLFFGDGVAEKWEYKGSDNAVSGAIYGRSIHSGSDRKCAVYPYREDLSVSGDVVCTVLPSLQEGRGSEMLLAALPSQGALVFRYACGFVCLHLDKGSVYKSAVLHGRGDEVLAGPVAVDLSGKNPNVKPASSAVCTTVEVHSAAGLPDDVWFCLPPLALQDGFNIRLETAEGKSKDLQFAGFTEISCGKVFECSASESKDVRTRTVDLDFRAGNTVFTESLPTSYSKGIFNADTGHPSGKTFSTSDGFGVTFYTVDGDADGGTLGVRWYARDDDHPEGGRIQMGRAGSYIGLPGIEGLRVCSVSLLMCGTSGAPYISATADGLSALTPKMYSLVSGEECVFELPGTEPGKGCYLMIHYKMLSFYRMKIIYRSI